MVSNMMSADRHDLRSTKASNTSRHDLGSGIRQEGLAGTSSQPWDEFLGTFASTFRSCQVLIGFYRVQACKKG
jgi:hypothetical protein